MHRNWLILLLLLSLIGLTACGTPATATLPPATTPAQNGTTPPTTTPATTEPSTPPLTTPDDTTTPPPTTTPPADPFDTWWEEYRQPFALDSATYPAFYRGAWGARLDELRDYLLNTAELRAAGFDTIMVEAEIVLDRETGQPVSLGEDVFIFYLQALKREGFRIVLIPNPMHPNLDMGLGYAWVEPDPDAYYHPTYELSKRFDSVVVYWAGIAAAYGADAFLPVLEPFKITGDYTVASQWLQEILPQIREVYPGPVWATDIMYDTDQGQSVPCPYDYTGYDLLLSGPPAGRKDAADWEAMMAGFIAQGNEYAADYNLEGFGLYEYGAYTGGIWYEDVQMAVFDQILSQEEARLIAEAYVRQADGATLASFPRVSLGWIDLGTPSFDVIADWYLSMGDVITPLEEREWTYDELIEIEQRLAGEDYEDIFQIEAGDNGQP